MKKSIARTGFLGLFVMMSVWACAQATPSEPNAVSPSVYQSPTFYALFFVAVVLLIYILQLSKVLRAVSTHDARKNGDTWEKFKMIVLLVGSTFLIPHATFASDSVSTESHPMLDFIHDGFGHNAINALVVIIVIELFVVLYFTRMIRLFVEKPKEDEPAAHLVGEESEVQTSVFWDKINASVAIAEESAVMMDHDYDGIRELDNNLPPWWKYGFYFTIVWTLGYLTYFHISAGPSSIEEYRTQITDGERAVAEYRARAKNLVDETNVVASMDQADLNAGKAIFAQHCAQCHAADGGGQIGPNLTDDYWLYGADIKDVFRTIKYGVNGKGMKSWQQELSPVLMAQVASFVKSLGGTTPMKPKAPDGEWVAAAHSTNAPSDTLKK